MRPYACAVICGSGCRGTWPSPATTPDLLLLPPLQANHYDGCPHHLEYEPSRRMLHFVAGSYVKRGAEVGWGLPRVGVKQLVVRWVDACGAACIQVVGTS